MTAKCDFCAEIRGDQGTHFDAVYGSILSTRVMPGSENFVVLPTVGQLFPWSLMILRVKHVETFCQLDFECRSEALELIDRVASLLSERGHVFGFEHGAHAVSRGGCGIYHAHFHLVPLPRRVCSSDIIE